ncbi:MAG TPA: RIP metalloprotease RseP [Candidatus Acidoferrum sp.]|jgi:regulator of sigma E protease
MNVIFGMILVLGVMILVHEWGHFVAARIFGVRVDVFSIGFGPRLFGWKRGATDYRISALPLGGYVRMAGQDPTEIDSADRNWGKKSKTTSEVTREVAEFRGADQLLIPGAGGADELTSKPRWQRAIISMAGPLVNLLFPIFLLMGYVVWVGIPHAAYLDKPVQVTAVPQNSSAAAAGLHPGDHVVSINGERTPDWEHVEEAYSKLTPDSTAVIVVENAAGQHTVQMPITKKDTEQFEQVLGFAPVKPILDDVEPGLPARRAGLREDDVIRSVDGQPVDWWGQFTERVRASNGKPLAVDVDRNGQTIHTVVTPQTAVNDRGETVYQIGVLTREDTVNRRVSFADGARYAALETWSATEQTVSVVGKLLSGKVSIKQLHSVVGISRAAGQAVSKGPLAVISLMVLISVNLGILNLLPIPILDGGNILLLAIEGSMRRDLSMAFKERFVQVGLVFLLVLLAYVMYNDVVRLLPIHS